MSFLKIREDDDEADIRVEESWRGRLRARLSCTDGFCGARDCYRCRGDDAELPETEE